LFEKFQVSLDILSQGTGVGLSLCKNLVDLLGGELWLDNTYDSGIKDCPGARFVISMEHPIKSTFHQTKRVSSDNLSMVQATDIECGLAQSPLVALPAHLSILFVDDDMMLRKLFSRAIKRVAPGWTIQEAANGETAIRLVEDHKFDMIFLDQYMASTEQTLLGTETARALRSKHVSSILCGLSANDLEKAFLSAGADFFVMKPMPCEKKELTRELLRMTASVRQDHIEEQDTVYP
jgi:CheY-like chemotaxis protein